MTDYETASLTFQQATLALSQEGLRLSYWQTMGAFVQAGVALVIGGLQCGLIYVGLQRMGEATAERKAQHEESMTVLTAQHEESMTVLTAQHEESLTVLKVQHEETMTALTAQHEESMTALTELIRRTAPRP